MAVQFFVNGALFASVVPRLPEIRDRVEITVGQVGLLLSLAGLAGLAGSAAVAPAIGRFGTRRVMMGAGAVVTLSLPVVGLARHQAVLLIGLVAMMTFDVLVDVAMNMQGSWLSSRRRVPVMNRLHGLWSLGTVTGGVAASRMAAAGVPLDVHLVGAALLLAAALVFVGRGLLRTDQPHEEPAVLEPPGRGRAGRPALVLFALAGLFAVAVETAAMDWAAFRFTDDYRLSAGSAAMGYVAVTVGMTAARFAGDWAAVRLGPDRLVWSSAALTGGGLAAATLVDGRAVNLVGYLIAGAGIATMLPTVYDQAAKLPGRPGGGLGALTAGLRTSGLTIPLLVGTLAATSLSVGSAVAMVTLPSVIGFAVATRLLPRPPAPGPEPDQGVSRGTR